VINNLDPFVSSKDIYAGTRWQAEIAAQLEATNFGIVCVTRDNQRSPWLNFEAGALAKAVETSRVVPLAVDLKPSDIELPLGQFQAQPASLQGLTEVLTSINAACPSSLRDELLNRALTVWWPELESDLKKIESSSSETSGGKRPDRSDRELLEEMLDTVRSLARSSAGRAPAQATKPLQEDHPLMDSIAELLAPNHTDSMVIRSSSGRTIGVRSSTAFSLEERREISRRCEIYGVGVVFLPSRKRVTPPSPEAVSDDDQSSGD
jgi:hypothetical protein